MQFARTLFYFLPLGRIEYALVQYAIRDRAYRANAIRPYDLLFFTVAAYRIRHCALSWRSIRPPRPFCSSPHKRVKIPRPYLHACGAANGFIAKLKIDFIHGLVQSDPFFVILKQVYLVAAAAKVT